MKTLVGLQQGLLSMLLIVIFISPLQLNAQKTKLLRSNGKTFKHIKRSNDAIVKNDDACEAMPFRTIDGTCNNISEPERTTWGASDIELRRSMATDYSEPDVWNDMAGHDRPSPRSISNIVCAQEEDRPSDTNLSSLVFTWGQFLDHDIDLTPEGHTEYEPIGLPEDEPLFTFDIPFLRSEIHEGTGVETPREQTNLITSWVDASNVYGSEETRANWLRTFEDGKLKTSANDLLPFNTIDGEYDSEIDPNAPSMAGDDDGTTKVFVAGDVRAAEQPGLTSLHTLFVREHNRYCDILIDDGLEDDEEIYQRARKWVGGIIQSITYNEFLPAFGIELEDPDGYKPNTRPDISNLFASAAYRLGHTMVTEELILRNNQCNAVGDGSVSLVEAFFNPEVVREHNIGVILKGLSMQVQQEVDIFVIDNLRNFLFASTDVPGTFGLDLPSLNIQRGRDHGLPDYNTIRAEYVGQAAGNWNQINNNPEIRNALQEAYDNDMNNIDAWVGMLAERHLPGKSVGPTLHAVLQDQFERLRDGDRYYYLHDPFLPNNIKNQIDNTQLSEVIERNTQLNQLPNNVFFSEECDPNDGGGNGGNGNGGNGGNGNGGNGGNGNGGNGGNGNGGNGGNGNGGNGGNGNGGNGNGGNGGNGNGGNGGNGNGGNGGNGNGGNGGNGNGGNGGNGNGGNGNGGNGFNGGNGDTPAFLEATLNLFPNPSSDFVEVSFRMGELSNVQMTILDGAGKVIVREGYSNLSGIFRETVDLSSLAKGIYLVNLEVAGEVYSKKLIVQ